MKVKALVALSIVAVASVAFSATAGAATAPPRHWYSTACPTMDYWGNRIVANPTVIDEQPGVGLSIVDGTGVYHPTTQQFVYYRLWAYSYKFGTWYTSPWKRSLGGFPGASSVQAYDATHGRWAYVDTGIDNADLAVGPNAVSIRPSTGSGTWAYGVETYWAPPFVNETVNDLTNPNPASGGLDTYDSSTQTCTF